MGNSSCPPRMRRIEGLSQDRGGGRCHQGGSWLQALQNSHSVLLPCRESLPGPSRLAQPGPQSHYARRVLLGQDVGLEPCEFPEPGRAESVREACFVAVAVFLIPKLMLLTASSGAMSRLPYPQTRAGPLGLNSVSITCTQSCPGSSVLRTEHCIRLLAPW